MLAFTDCLYLKAAIVPVNTNITLTVSLQDAARAKALRAKFEEWEAAVGEDGGYINLVDENGCALETASKLKNRYCCPSLGHTTHGCFAGLRS